MEEGFESAQGMDAGSEGMMQNEMAQDGVGHDTGHDSAVEAQWSDYGADGAGQQDGAEVQTAAQAIVQDGSPMEGEGAKELLDSLMEGAGQHAQQEVQNRQAQGQQQGQQQSQGNRPVDEADALIREAGIRSERGQERIRAMVAARKDAETRAAGYEEDIGQFREVMQQSGLSAEDFGTLLEYGRLLNSGSDTDARVALEMLDGQREALCKRLGIDAPGVDALSDFPELKQAVEDMEITHERALQLARYQRQEQAVQLQRRAEYQHHAELQQFNQQLEQAKSTAESYFATRAHEVDHQAKINRMAEWLKTGDNLMRFVKTYEPHQYVAQLQFMYDHMSVPQHGGRALQPQPLRSRNAMTGRQMSNGALDNSTNIHSHIDALGI